MNDINFALTIVKETNSTNDDIEALLNSDIARDAGLLNFCGYSVLAFTQSAGRGRFERRWDSQYGGLYLSTLIFKDSLGDAFNFNMIVIITALSTLQAIQNYAGNNTLGIKWPNDIVADNKKICGILIKALAGLPGTPVIIGAGVNVFNKIDRNILRNSSVLEPVNLEELAFAKFNENDITALAAEILSRLNYNLKKAASGSYNEIFADYNSKLLYVGEKITLYNRIEDESKTAEGIFRGIDENGFLLIENIDDNKIKTYPSGEIKKL